MTRSQSIGASTTWEELRESVFALRCASRRGEKLSDDDRAFLQRAYRQFPVDYTNLNAEIETRPHE